jgi:hypothetical protein
VPTLPGSLDESLKALEADHDFLLKGDVFSPQLIERWISYNAIARSRRCACARIRWSFRFTTIFRCRDEQVLIRPIGLSLRYMGVCPS